MSERGEGHREPSGADLGVGCLLLALIVIGLPLTFALFAMGLQDAGSKEGGRREVVEFAGTVDDAPINAGDERAMHAVGLPTRLDVLEWHETGRWGYGRIEGGEYVVRTFDELPDGAALWDGIYGLDNSDPKFNYR